MAGLLCLNLLSIPFVAQVQVLFVSEYCQNSLKWGDSTLIFIVCVSFSTLSSLCTASLWLGFLGGVAMESPFLWLYQIYQLQLLILDIHLSPDPWCWAAVEVRPLV